MPPITDESATPTTPLTTLGVGGPCGAILGKYKHPNPSAFMLNSTNAGVTLDPCILASLGVVMETRHLTLVSGTGQPVDLSFFSTSNGVLFSSILACLDRGQLVLDFSEWARSSSAGRQLRGEPSLKKSLQMCWYDRLNKSSAHGCQHLPVIKFFKVFAHRQCCWSCQRSQHPGDHKFKFCSMIVVVLKNYTTLITFYVFVVFFHKINHKSSVNSFFGGWNYISLYHFFSLKKLP